VIASGNARRRGTLAVYAFLVVSCGDSLSSSDADVDRIDVTPSAVGLTVGETRAITAQVFDAAGERLLNRRVFWTSQDATVATVSQSGVITGTGSGNTQIAASAGGKSGLVAVSVNARPVSLVRVVPATATVQAGGTITLAAEALDASGAEVIGRPVAWASSNTAIASVSLAGQVTGVATGTVTITATIDGVGGSASITVTSVPVANVRITPDAGTVQQGGSLQLSATGFDSQGTALPGRQVTWSSSSEAIATVSSSGRVAGIGEGTVTITAVIEGVSGTGTYSVTRVPVATLTVVPASASVLPGGTFPLAVTLTGTNGQPLSTTGRVITWTSSDNAVATVSTIGMVTGVATGSATITATTEGVSGTATVTVSATPVASVTVTPSPATVVEGGTTTLVATAFDAGGNVLTGRTAFWESSNPQVSVSQNGVVTAVLNSATQQTTIKASVPGGGVGGATPSGSATVSVTHAPVASVVLTPQQQSILVSQTTVFGTSLTTASGQSLSPAGRTITWRSLDPIVSVNASSGLITGVAVGGPAGVEVSASSPGQTMPALDTGFVTVLTVAVGSVQLSTSPDSLILPAGTTSVTATVLDGASNPLNGRLVTFSPSANVSPSSAMSSASGQVLATITGTTAGTVQIIANAEGEADTVNVRMLEGIASISLAPGTDSIIGSSSLALTATALGTTPLPGRPLTVQSSNPAVTISPSTATPTNASGALAITVAFPTTPATTTLTVGGEGKSVSRVIRGLAPVASVQATTPGDSVAEFGTLQATVNLLDAGGGTITGRPVTWNAIAETGTVSISSSGLITGLTAGTASITASSEGKTSPAVPLRVLALPVTSVSITPGSATVAPGASTPSFTAQVFRAGGPAVGRTCDIAVTAGQNNASVAPATAVTDQQGQFTFVVSGKTNGAGQATITATCEGVSGTATVTVQ
jgi:uncharacterized protein YjdB